MRWLHATLALALFTVTAAAEGPKALTFTKDDLGAVPRGWKSEQTGTGEGSVWKVVADDTAPSKKGYALAQTSDRGSGTYFNLCVATDARYTDLEVSVAFKAVQGKEDQGGGVVWRYRDADNYYLCRMNPLEDNFRVYKVVAGKRIQLATTRDDVKAPGGEWHTVKATMKGDRIECFLNGKKLLDATDDTFKGAGKVGLWSKADAQTRFDMLTVKGK